MEQPIQNLIWKECKSYWNIEKIDKSKVNENCEYWIDMKLIKDWKYYLFTGNWFDKNISDKTILNSNSSCDTNWNYSFTEWQSLQVWDTIYFIAEYWYNNILKSWKDIYDANLNLPDCWQYLINFEDWNYNNPQNYEIMNICKVSWKIESLLRTPEFDNCWYSLNLKINHNNQISYIYNTTEQLIDKDWNYCIWWDYMFSFTNPPKIWDNFYWLADTKTNQLLKVWKTRYDQYNQLSDCTWAVILSNNWETILNNSWNIISSNTNEIQTWKSLENNISVPKKEIIIPKKIVKSSSKQDIENIKNDNQISEILTWTLETKTESNSWITDLTWASNKAYKTETWVIIKQENEMINSNSIWINWFYIISIILISIISLIFINKRFKSL